MRVGKGLDGLLLWSPCKRVGAPMGAPRQISGHQPRTLSLAEAIQGKGDCKARTLPALPSTNTDKGRSCGVCPPQCSTTRSALTCAPTRPLARRLYMSADFVKLVNAWPALGAGAGLGNSLGCRLLPLDAPVPMEHEVSALVDPVIGGTKLFSSFSL